MTNLTRPRGNRSGARTTNSFECGTTSNSSTCATLAYGPRRRTAGRKRSTRRSCALSEGRGKCQPRGVRTPDRIAARRSRRTTPCAEPGTQGNRNSASGQKPKTTSTSCSSGEHFEEAMDQVRSSRDFRKRRGHQGSRKVPRPLVGDGRPPHPYCVRVTQVIVGPGKGKKFTFS